MFDRSPLLSWYKTHIWYHNQNQNQFPISFLCFFFPLKEIYTFQNNVIGEKVLSLRNCLPFFFFLLCYYIEMWQITPSYVPAFWQMIVLNTIFLLFRAFFLFLSVPSPDLCAITALSVVHLAIMPQKPIFNNFWSAIYSPELLLQNCFSMIFGSIPPPPNKLGQEFILFFFSRVLGQTLFAL